MKRAIISARISSSGSLESRQSTERQVIDLTDYANTNSMAISKTFEEHISGAKRNEERAVLTECIEYAISNRVDVILFSELSRCGRAVWEILETITTLKDNNINALIDDRENLNIGAKIQDCKVLETPYLVVLGDKTEGDNLEIENTKTGEKQIITVAELIQKFK